VTDRPAVAVVGAGRMGQGLALALLRGGCRVALYARTPREVVAGPEPCFGDPAAATAGRDAVILAVPDDAVAATAAELRERGAVGSGQVALHLSGGRDRSALQALEGVAAGIGSFWPIQTVPEPGIAPERFAGAYVGLEGDPSAIEMGERLARALGMTPVVIPSEGKIRAHAGAVVAGNYPIVLLALAESLAEEAGIAPALAREVYLPLLRAAVENAAALGTGAALTGPLRRGDVETVRSHLATLGAAERRTYQVLGLGALDLLQRAGVTPPNLAALRKVLRSDD
jgi:predicted short-subunit dehydrogenase-like oxidoreductase (DUF2520 family)